VGAVIVGAVAVGSVVVGAVVGVVFGLVSTQPVNASSMASATMRARGCLHMLDWTWKARVRFRVRPRRCALAKTILGVATKPVPAVFGCPAAAHGGRREPFARA
jgi:hypothetical protein